MKNIFRLLIVSILCIVGAESALTQAQYVNIKSFGAIGDGNSHPLSSIYSTLGAAQAVYPFVDDLNQEVDWAATQAAIDYAFAHGQQNVFCPATNTYQGFYNLSLPIYIDPPNNMRAANNLQRWSSTATYVQFNEVLYNGLAWAAQVSGIQGATATPTISPGYPGTITIPATQNGPAATNTPWADVQISNASPAVVTLTAHGLTAGTAIRFVVSPTDNNGATGALPTGINSNTAYYILAAGLTANTFEISLTPGGAAINTSSAGVGTFGISNQLWAIDPSPPGDLVANLRVNFIGEEGQGSNWGCRFLSRSIVGPAFVVGPGNGNVIKNISINGPAYPAVSNDYRCQRPNAIDNVLYFKGVSVPNAGITAASVGGGASRTLFENVGVFGFYFGYLSGWPNNGNQQLDEQNTWFKSSFTENCHGVDFAGNTQAFINTMYDGSVVANTIGVNAAIEAGINLFGGSYSNTNSQANAFAVTGVTVSGDNVSMTVTTPDRFLMHPLCSIALQCIYNSWTIRTAHYGIVPLTLLAWNPFTKLLTLTMDPLWIHPYIDQGIDGFADLIADIQAQTRVDGAEYLTHFRGNGIEVRGAHIEDNNSANMLVNATSDFGGGLPDFLSNIYFNAGITLAGSYSTFFPGPALGGPPGTGPCTSFPNPNIAPGPSDIAKCNYSEANFYTMQSNPFITMGGSDLIVDGLVGGFDVIPERGIIQQGGGLLEMRHTVGQGVNTANWIPLSFRGSTQFSQSQFTGSGGATPYIRDSVQALGMGLWDTAVSFLPAFPTSSANDAFFRGAGWGESPNWGIRPAPWANPCVTPAQATTLAGALPAITYTASLDSIKVLAAGTGYTAHNYNTGARGSILNLVNAGAVGTAGQIEVLATGGGGAITRIQINQVGNGGGSYTTAPNAAATFTSTVDASGPPGGSGATFNGASYDVLKFNVGYPLLWGGTTYRKCDWQVPSQTKYALQSTNFGYSYFQNLTTTNVPNLSWTAFGPSPYVYLNREALEVLFPGLVISLVGAGGCAGNTYTAMVTNVHVLLGYADTVNAAQDGPPSTSPFPAGTSCTGTSITMAAPNLVNPY